MGSVSQIRRDRLRSLHESYAVPLPVLAEAFGLKPDTVERLSLSQDWAPAMPTRAALAQLSSVFLDTVAAMRDGRGDDGIDDKTARALATLVKALEQLVGLHRQLDGQAAGPTDTNMNPSDHGQPDFNAGLAGGPKLVAELDRRLAAIVDRVEQGRPSE